MIESLLSVVGQRGVDALAFLLAFALTAVMDSVFHDKLPHDHGREFAPSSPPAPSAMRSAGGPGAETVPLCRKAKESLRLCRRLSLCTPAQRLWR